MVRFGQLRGSFFYCRFSLFFTLSRPPSLPATQSALRVPRPEDMPKGFLQSLTGKHVCVKLKWGMEYRGA